MPNDAINYITLWEIIKGKEIKEEQRPFIRKTQAQHNCSHLRILTAGMFIFFIICLALDLNHILQTVQPDVYIWSKAIWHAIGLIFSAISFYIVKSFSFICKAETIDDANVAKFSTFTVVFAHCLIILSVILVLIEQQNNSAAKLIYYLLAITPLVAFIQYNQKTTAVMFLFGWLLLSFLLPYYQQEAAVVTSTVVLSFVITIGGFITSSILYNNFIQSVIHDQLIKKQNVELVKSNQAKDAILSVVAHDLRTPVTNIDQLVELLLHPSTTEEEKQHFATLIHESCQQAYQIIEDILEMSHGNKDLIQRKQTDIIELINTVVEGHMQRIKQKEINFNFIHDEEHLIANVNRSRLTRLVDNLLTNAIKFTPHGGQVEVLCKKHADKLMIRIKDTGIGIPDDLLPHIFQPFSQASRKGLEGEKTTGLGLSIVKRIVEQHGGTIDVESKERQGTAFTIYLPE